MTRLLTWIGILMAAIGVGGVTAVGWLAWRGIGTSDPPGGLETTVARTARHYLIPARARSLVNPVPATDEVFRDGMTHFADHCASCHGNDGSGDTELGRGLYPRSPDMRLPATQQLSDGELFYIIEEGVKLTGMPRWGTGTEEGARSSWALVHFIRRLPTLTDDQILEMEALNPRGEAEWREAEETRRFLAGDEPPQPPAHKH